MEHTIVDVSFSTSQNNICCVKFPEQMSKQFEFNITNNNLKDEAMRQMRQMKLKKNITKTET